MDAHGRIDILYNNAGAVRFGPIDEQSFADWRFTLAAELDSIFLTCKHAWPHLRESRGVILNIGSTAGLTGSMTNQRVAHSASKGGVIAVTRQLAAEGAPHGIRANAISPGMIATPGAEENLLAPITRCARSRTRSRWAGSAPPRTSSPRPSSSAVTRPPTSPEPTWSSTAAGRLCSPEHNQRWR